MTNDVLQQMHIIDLDITRDGHDVVRVMSTYLQQKVAYSFNRNTKRAVHA